MSQLKIVTTDELITLINNNSSITLIDARTKQWDDGRRIGSAIALPADTAPTLFNTYLPKKDAALVVYCGGGPCPLAKILASKLMEHGYTNVSDYAGGIREWANERSLPVTMAKSTEDCDSVCQV